MSTPACSSSLDKVYGLESRGSSDTYEDHTLLEQNQKFRPRLAISIPKRLRLINGPTYALICSAVLVTASIIIWSRVFFQLNHIYCNVGTPDEFEPDCESF